MDTNISEATFSLSVDVMDKLEAMTNNELGKFIDIHISADSPELIRELRIRYFGLLAKLEEHHDAIK